ncbi:MAG: glycosyl hydrolase 115 family protein [Bacteroides sp.]|nr:glycosyl hydrolase 115 family protein [Bacteroides sp.]
MNISGYISLIACLILASLTQAQTRDSFVLTEPAEDAFSLTHAGITVPVLIDENDHPGVHRAYRNLLDDIRRVTGADPIKFSEQSAQASGVVCIGTVGKSREIDRLVAEGKINGNELKGKYEKYIIQTITEPWPGVEEALVIAGSDKRGTIYGIYELSDQIGVSPWYYWADVPDRKSKYLYVIRGKYTEGEPAVRYRGIFLNDEWPSLGSWVTVTFGGFNSHFYEKVFEWLLRLKGNYLWPAMWNGAFYDDDPLNGPLADEMGIVIGTSHHEPMGRAHKEWGRYGSGAWDYTTNRPVLDEFWKGGVQRLRDWESVVTIGMRGDGDEAMSEDTNLSLLEKIVREQRKIIQQATGKKAAETPQLWALYKEVQEYYDKGMRVPDDVTLLLCDDNWGNVRKLPELTARPRQGGYGMYYHFDYVGGPRNYKWINVSQVPRIWEQMNLTYRYGVDRLWVVNVGDLKPMEYPIQFFLDMAWDPDRFRADNLLQHTEAFCKRQFGAAYGAEAARLIHLYTKYNRRVTPELLGPQTYSLHHYDEFRRVTEEYRELQLDALRLYYLIPDTHKDAYDQLVLFPVQACGNLYELYYAVAMNHDLAAKGDTEANTWADRARRHYERDSLLTLHYHRDISGGKWRHMMDQTHIGYTGWQQPETNIMPQVHYLPGNHTAALPPVFLEADGYVSIEAPHYTRMNNGQKSSWLWIPDLGKTVGAMTTTPVTVHPDTDTYLDYEIEFTSSGEVTVEILVSPTLNFNANRGLRYAVSFDGAPEQIVTINGAYDVRQMEEWQAQSINRTATRHTLDRPGRHTLRFRALEPGVVLQKILIDTGGLQPSYLGAPESKIIH